MEPIIDRKDLFSSTGGRETHAIIQVSDPMLSMTEQIMEITLGLEALRRDCGDRMKPVFCRWMLSDAANQVKFLPDIADCAVSVVEQPPLRLTKAALWVWMWEDITTEKLSDNVYAVSHGDYVHIFQGGCCRPGADSEAATYDMLSSHDRLLRRLGGDLYGNCVRTWFFVQNVDVNYSGVVRGRNRAFTELGLTPQTHFIASTGIGGRHADRAATVQMDCYSIKGLKEGQTKYINAPEYLNPTCEYGVAFERAASVDYADRRHLFISGTASINNRGEIMHEGDVRRQTLRMWTNVEALLNAGGCGWKDVGQILVYLRDPADYAVVSEMFGHRFPDTPHVILLAPVCRPGWLVEMECMAMKPTDSDFAPF